MKRLVTVCAVLLLIGADYARAGIWTRLDCPYANRGTTRASGVSGNNVIGYYSDPRMSGYMQSFLYDGTTWTTLSCPGQRSTFAYSISGGKIAGIRIGMTGGISGFLYDGTNWTTLSYPDAGPTFAYSVSDSRVVGTYWDGSHEHGFLYSETGYTTLDYPGATDTCPTYINGGRVFGRYYDSLGQHNFLYDQTGWTTLDYSVVGIDGSRIISSSQFYDGANWATLDDPDGYNTYLTGISGYRIVGTSLDNTSDNLVHGFIYIVPEPCTLVFLSLGSLVLRRPKG